jgi:Domain of unknown function (DUF2017)
VSEFTSEPGYAVRVRLEEHEADVIRNLVTEMRAMLESGRAGDPVMERLFPRAYTQESDEQAYKELLGSDLESSKKEALDTLAQSIGESGSVDSPLSAEQAGEWLAALNDIRLAIGTRLDVSEETMSQELDPEDEKSPAMAVLHWLGWVQESIIDRISRQE